MVWYTLQSEVLYWELSDSQAKGSACERVIHKSRTLTHAPWCYIWEMWDATTTAQKRPLADTLFSIKNDFKRRWPGTITGRALFAALKHTVHCAASQERRHYRAMKKSATTHIHLLCSSHQDLLRCVEKKSGEKRVQEYEFSLLHSFLKAHTLWNGKGRKDVTLSTRGALCDVLWHY